MMMLRSRSSRPPINMRMLLMPKRRCALRNRCWFSAGKYGARTQSALHFRRWYLHAAQAWVWFCLTAPVLEEGCAGGIPVGLEWDGVVVLEGSMISDIFDFREIVCDRDASCEGLAGRSTDAWPQE